MGEDGGYGSRSQFESEIRWVNPTRTAGLPMQNSYGTITPSGLHYERHHAGIPNIDPARHRLVIHGLVDRPIKYSLADLKRFPTISRTYFMECSGTTGSELMKVTQPTVQRTHGFVSTSEWTGVPLSTLLKQTGLQPRASWVLAEGADGAVMTRSVPIDKCLSDALIVFGKMVKPSVRSRAIRCGCSFPAGKGTSRSNGCAGSRSATSRSTRAKKPRNTPI